MAEPLRVHPEARAEFLEAVDYYEKHASRGEHFARAVGETYARVLAGPETFPPVRGTRSMRGAKVRGYPYRVFFLASSADVLVVAVSHRRRRPGHWRKRLG